jgi:signal transduction histidine kinase
MLHEFLATNRAALIDGCRAKAALRRLPRPSDAELEHGIPLFVDQLVKTLRLEQTPEPMRDAAARHGLELLRHGVTVDQVVHDYGDLCQSITDLALELGTPIDVDEFRTLNRCLDNAIADAVAEFEYQRDLLIEDRGIQALNERLGFLAHELRNHIHSATLAVSAIKSGNVGLAGATGAVLDRSLIGLRNLIDRSLADVRVTAGMPVRRSPVSLAGFVAEVRATAGLEAQARGCAFTAGTVDAGLAVLADRELLAAAVGNLLQNAFKFTERQTEVSLHAHAAGDRVLIEVEDHCGGLPSGAAKRMFQPFVQNGADRSGLGLGLTICRKSVEANHGVLRVRDRPGSGCVFTIDLPRHEMPASVPSP